VWCARGAGTGLPGGWRPAAGESPTLNAERRRVELFDAVVALLAASSASGPLVVVLDDLHAADEGSLLLLSFLARQLHGMSLLVVASQRDVDAAPPPAVGREIGRSIRTGAVARYDPMGPVATRWRVRA